MKMNYDFKSSASEIQLDFFVPLTFLYKVP